MILEMLLCVGYYVLLGIGYLTGFGVLLGIWFIVLHLYDKFTSAEYKKAQILRRINRRR